MCCSVAWPRWSTSCASTSGPAPCADGRSTTPTSPARNPGLVMFHLSAFGRDSVDDRPGFARIAEAYAGLTHMTGPSDGPPMFAGFPIADGVAGAHGAFAVMLALFERSRTGQGQLVDFALYEPLLRMLDGVITSCDVTGEVPQRGRQRQPRHRAERSVVERGRRLGGAPGLVAQHVAPAVRGDRPARAHRRPEVRHEHRAGRAPRRARPRDRRGLRPMAGRRAAPAAPGPRRRRAAP